MMRSALAQVVTWLAFPFLAVGAGLMHLADWIEFGRDPDGKRYSWTYEHERKL